MTWLLAKTFGRVTVTVVVAVAFVATAQGLGTYLKATTAHWVWLPSWISSLASWLGEPPPPELNYQAIVTAALAVIGTLTGVFFATVAFVVSTTYKDATSEVRALITRLPGGRVYTFVYVQAVLFGLITLTLPMIGREPNRFSLCLVTLLGGFVVLSFGRLRIQLYGLLEPVGLLPVVRGDLARWIAQASRLVGRDPTGLRTRLCRDRTVKSLLALRDLCYLIRERERAAANVPAEYAGADPRVHSAARQVLAVWLQYARCKQALVQRSGWCPRRGQHKDWLLASNSEVGIALATATTLQATPSVDPLWVERHLSVILGELVGGRKEPQLASILGSLNDPVRKLVSRGMFAEARLWLDTVVGPAKTATTQPPTHPAPGEPSQQTVTSSAAANAPAAEGPHYNLVDFVALAYTQAVLGLHDYADALATEFPRWVVTQALGKGARSVGPLPAKLLTNLRDGLKFEEAVEGHRVTSDANIRQLVARAVATEAIDEAAALMATFENDLWPWASRVGDDDTTAAGAALSRLDEALHKWELPLSALSRLFDQCEAVHRDVDDRWPDLSLDKIAARRTALQDQLRAPIVKLATRVDVDMDPDRPDVFGWAFYRAHQDLLEDVLSDLTPVRADLEVRLRGLIHATDRAGGRLRATVQREHARVLGSVWSEPTLLLLQLSGIALVTALARQRMDLLEVFEQVWDELLAPGAQRVLDSALTALIMDDALLGLSSGKINRSNRHQQAIAVLRDAGLPHDDLGYDDLDESHRDSNARLAAMLRHAAHGDFEDVFVAAWLVPAAQRRGAVLRARGLGSRLTHLVETLAEPAEDEARTQGESDAPGTGDNRGEGH